MAAMASVHDWSKTGPTVRLCSRLLATPLGSPLVPRIPRPRIDRGPLNRAHFVELPRTLNVDRTFRRRVGPSDARFASLPGLPTCYWHVGLNPQSLPSR